MNASELIAPMAKVMPLATIHVYQNNQLIRTIQIEDMVELEEAGFFQKFLSWLSASLASLQKVHQVPNSINPEISAEYG